MTEKIRIRCPGCSSMLQLSAQSKGTKVTCPKCGKVMQVGQSQSPAPTSPLTSAPVASAPVANAPTANAPVRASKPASKPVASGVVPAKPAVAQPVSARPVKNQPVVAKPVDSSSGFPLLDSDLPPAATQPAASNPFSYSAPNQYSSAVPSSYQAGAYQPSAYTPVSRPSARSSRRESPALTDSQSQLQSSGIFLTILPAIAAILPFFGLQLRRIADAGEFAPVIAMFLGFLGAGLIGYARKLRSDWIGYAAASFLFSLTFGVGGYVAQKNYLYNDPALASGNSTGTTQSNGPKLTSEQMKKMQQEAEENHKRRMEELDKEVERMRSNVLGSAPLNDNTTTNGFGDSALKGSFNESMKNPPSISSGETEGNSRGAASNSFQQDPAVVGNLMRIRGDGFARFGQARVNEAQFANQFEYVSLVGRKSFAGRIHEGNPEIQSLCNFTLAQGIDLLPISPTATGIADSITPSAGQTLVGLNLAFANESVVGVQGVFRGSGGATNLEEGPWIGQSTSDVRKSLCLDKPNNGFVIFIEGPNTIGFAWLVRK